MDDTQQGEAVRIDDPRDFPPREDGYQRLWTPQRMSYVLRGNKDGDAKKPHGSECPFCAGPKKSDEDGLIAWRGTYVFAIMNLYPYNCGHLMICPYRHVSLLTDLTDDELFEFEKASALAMDVMREVSHPDGWNLGINQGDVAGAGVATHLHQHIVPRWNGDSNFMPIVAQTRTMPILLHEQREAYAEGFATLAPSHGLPAQAPATGNDTKDRN
ncbi:HIT family protein [Pseudoscardovia suis]|uniref:Hydrolase n=1 Tax=Pseudoscardovia suis TaxID=987063 RepID=A0A261ERU9_9BIFI|nr:HIT domain-containing protein [Pseudoscardovia suis]OZG49578.1 hydrolase [Pseudoscardovia suis]PJJ69697.1 ATP adenylyltransferase [Pseudoscardovia suis]